MLVRTEPLKPGLLHTQSELGLKPWKQKQNFKQPFALHHLLLYVVNFFSNTVKMYILLGCMVRDKKSNAENGKMPA